MQNKWQKGLVIRSLRSYDEKSLFKIYLQCTRRDWRSFLEIDSDNFLDRFIEYPCYTGLMKLLVKRKIMIAEKEGSTMGYVLVAAPRSPQRKTPVKLYFFLSNRLSTVEAIAFTGEILKLLRRAFSNVHLYFTSVNEQKPSEIASELRSKFGFAVSQYLVAMKKL